MTEKNKYREMGNSPRESLGIAHRLLTTVNTYSREAVLGALPKIKRYMDHAASDVRAASDDELNALKQMYATLESMYPRKN